MVNGGEEGVAGRVGEMISTHAVLFLEVSDDRIDGGAASQLTLDPPGDAAYQLLGFG